MQAASLPGRPRSPRGTAIRGTAPMGVADRARQHKRRAPSGPARVRLDSGGVFAEAAVMHETDIAAIAAEALAAFDAGARLVPFTTRHRDLDLDQAYRVAAALRRL